MSMPAAAKCMTILVVPTEVGLHARPAAMLAKTAQQYDADIEISCGRRKVNAKSIMGILTLCAGKGARVTVTATGSDAAEAISAIEDLFAHSLVQANLEPRPGSRLTKRDAAVAAHSGRAVTLVSAMA